MRRISGRLYSVLSALAVVLSIAMFLGGMQITADAAGTYSVTFKNGSTVVSTVAVGQGEKVSSIPEVSQDGYIFAGWYTNNVGTITDINSVSAAAYDFNAGVTRDTTLYAGWLNIGTGSASMIYLEGVQFRNADDNTSGIRFVSRIDVAVEDNLKALNNANSAIRPSSSADKGLGYGTVVTMKSNIPSNGYLVKDENARYVAREMVVVPAAVTYKWDGNNRYYTAVITGMTAKYFDTDMAARPYITYYDANNNLRTYYYTENEGLSYGGAYYTTYNKVVKAYESFKEPETTAPPTTEYVEYGYPDVVVSSVSTIPAVPRVGDEITFAAVITNKGTASTPAGVITGVKFTVNGSNAAMWSDTYTASIKPGQSITVKANGGTNGSTWKASSTGNFSVTAYVDDVNRYTEGNENNNTLAYSYTVYEKSEIDYVVDPVTGDNCIDGFGNYKFASFYNAGLLESESGSLRVNSNGNLTESNQALVYSFVVNEDMYFDRAVDKIVLDAGATAASGAVLNIYGEESAEPVLTRNLSSTEGNVKQFMLDLSESGLKGSESIKFEVVLANNTSASDFELKNFRFMYADIPTVYVNIDESLGTIAAMNADKDKLTECYGNILISSPEGYICEYTGKAGTDYSVALEYIRGRGNSTWEAPKKPYKVKLAKKTDLFGMGKSKHWCLLANFYDKSLMRNKLAYNLATDMGIPFTSSSVFVDVVMNDEYLGSYLLSEQVRVDDYRVEIDNLEDTPDATDEETISGGYLIEITPYERVKPDEVYFGANYVQKAMVFESPSFETGINQAQYNYMSDYYHRMEEAVYSQSGYNSRGEYWTDLLDLNSAVDYYLIEELFKNNDAMYASARFYKPRGDKLYMGPVWDFDLTAGTYACNYTENPEGWFVKNEYIFSALMRRSEFREAVKARYWQIHDDITAMYTDTAAAPSVINQYADQLRYTQSLNFDKWGFGNNGWNNILSQGSWTNEVNYLNSWLQRRVSWMDANINNIG